MGTRLFIVLFSRISELVVHNENGLIFHDVPSLVTSILTMVQGFPNSPKLAQFKKNLEQNFCQVDWDINWQQNALPLFQQI